VPQNAALISASAVADYECALGGYIVASGLAAGELVEATQTAARWNYDRRNVEAVDALYATSGCEGIGVYTPLNTARYTNDQAVQRLEGGPTPGAQSAAAHCPERGHGRVQPRAAG
jgi:starch-binding outer membrane protein, SusD/RagB family